MTILRWAGIPAMAALCLVATARSTPSDGCIKGIVRDSVTQEPLSFATVFDSTSRRGLYSNRDGGMKLCSMKPGQHTLVASMLGYGPRTVIVDVVQGDTVHVTFDLAPTTINTNNVVVTADRGQFEASAVSTVSIPMQQIRQMRFGGESDVSRAVLMLPGVLAASQVSNGLFIRGGSPDQNLVLLDGMTVYNPSHLFGMISAFNSEAVQSVELQKGGFPAEYGNRMSAVMNVTQKDGNRERIEGMVGVGLLSSRLALQGPLGNGSWFVGGRRTYADLLMGALPQDPQDPFPRFNFHDLNVKVSQYLGTHKFTLSGIQSRDVLTLDQTGLFFDVGVGNAATSLSWQHAMSSGLVLHATASASQYVNHFSGRNDGQSFGISNSITDYSLRAGADLALGDRIQMKAGYEGTLYRFAFDQTLEGARLTEGNTPTKGPAHMNFTDDVHGAFAQASFEASPQLTIVGGLRAGYWTMKNAVTFDPRLSLRYQLSDDITIKGAWGLYHQYLRMAAVPNYSFFDIWLPTDETAPISRADHYILSVETRPTEDLLFNVDVYYKRQHNINEVNTLQTSTSTVADIFHFGSASSYGIEFFLQRRYGALTGWIGYALGWVDAQFADVNGGLTYHPKYDRRHDFKVTLLYDISDTWEVGATFTLQSGQGYTAATSQFGPTLMGEGMQGGMVMPSQQWGRKLPASHQLNMVVTYKTTLADMPFNIVLDIFNVYARRDILMRTYETDGGQAKASDVQLLPIIPTISAELRF